MMSSRVAAATAASLLALGIAAPAALADSGTPGPSTTSTTSARPTVAQTGNAFTVSLPGVGSLMFTVDPATGNVSNLVATADAVGGFTAGTPKVTDEGVQVTFMSPAGDTKTLAADVERENGTVSVKPEVEHGNGGDNNHHDEATTTTVAGTPPTTEVHGDNNGDNNGDHHDESPTTTVATGTAASSPSTTAVHQDDSANHDNSNNGSHDGPSHDSSGGSASGGSASGGSASSGSGSSGSGDSHHGGHS